MAEAAIAEDIENHIGAKGLAELDGDPRRMDDRLRVVTIYMKDRRHHHLGNIGRIGRGTRIMRARGKADLVVVDDMNRAAGAVAAKSRKSKGLGNNALSGESCVPMQQ